MTEEEAHQLQQTLNRLRNRNERTSIVAIPAFRAAERFFEVLKMKKILSVCAVLSVCSSLLTACGNKAKPTPNAPHPETKTLPKTEPSTLPSSIPDSDLHPINIDGIRLNFIDLPAVTEEDVVQLQETLNGLRNGRERTSIVVMPAFRAAEAKTSIGLYRAVIGAYPEVVGCYSFELNGRFTQQDAENKYREWDANPDLPLVCTTGAQDIAFAERLSQITGRRLGIMSDSKNEYSIRGRIRNENGSWGAITTTRFHFGGDEEDQVRNRAFTHNNPLTLGVLMGSTKFLMDKMHFIKTPLA